MKPFLNNVTKIAAILAVLLLFVSKVEAQKYESNKRSNHFFSSFKEQKLVRIEEKINQLTRFIEEGVKFQTTSVDGYTSPILTSYSIPARAETNKVIHGKKVRESKGTDLITDDNAFKSWLTTNLQQKLNQLDKKGSGEVTIRFAINEKGNLTDAKITSSSDLEVNEVVLDLLKDSPQWQVKKLQEQPYKLYYSIVVKYNIVKL